MTNGIWKDVGRRLRSDGPAGRLSRYILVGGTAAVVDLGGFLLLVEMEVRTAAAAAASFAVAALFNFALASAVVFQVAPTYRRLVLFAAFALVGLSINTAVTTGAAVLLPDWLAKISGIGCAFGANFWMNDRLVFRRK